MGREATKAQGNVWYEARKEAAKWDERLLSREGAAERLGMSVSAIADAELGLSKCMPPDKAVLMADLYRAPHLLNYYCLNECPIGCDKPVSADVLSIDRVTVKLLMGTRVEKLSEINDKLLRIAADGQVTPDEVEDLKEITEYLEGLSKTVSELKTISEIAAKRGEAGCTARKDS